MNGGTYRVVASKAVQDGLLGLAEAADRAGIRKECGEALRAMYRELRDRPREWGDPSWNLYQMGLVVYFRIAGRFTFSYAVDQVNRIVYLRWVRLLDA